MNETYIAVESLSALVIFILIYANINEIKQRSKKRSSYILFISKQEVICDKGWYISGRTI